MHMDILALELAVAYSTCRRMCSKTRLEVGIVRGMSSVPRRSLPVPNPALDYGRMMLPRPRGGSTLRQLSRV